MTHPRFTSNHARFTDEERRQALADIESALRAFSELLDLIASKGCGKMPRTYMLLEMIFGKLASAIELEEVES